VWWWLLLGLAGCDRFLRLDTVPTPPDAPEHVVCSQLVPTPFFCADFDEATLQYYTDGHPAAVIVPASGVAVTTTDTELSPPNALLVDSKDGSMFMIEDAPTMPTATYIHASFAMKVVRTPPNYRWEALRISFNGANQCDATFQVDPGSGLRLRTDCDPRTEVVVFPAIPTDWQHVDLELDATGPTATMTVGSDSQTQSPVPLGPVEGPPEFRFGLLYARSTTTDPIPPAIAYDDVIVTTR